MDVLVLSVVVVVSIVVVGTHVPEPGERIEFRDAMLRLRNTLTDWDASHCRGR